MSYAVHKTSCMTLSSQEKHLFLLFSYFRAHPTTLLLKILGGTDAWAVPHLKFFLGTVPLGLRPAQVHWKSLENQLTLPENNLNKFLCGVHACSLIAVGDLSRCYFFLPLLHIINLASQ